MHKNKKNKTKQVTRLSATAKRHCELRCECEGFCKPECETRYDGGGSLDDAGLKYKGAG